MVILVQSCHCLQSDDSLPQLTPDQQRQLELIDMMPLCKETDSSGDVLEFDSAPVDGMGHTLGKDSTLAADDARIHTHMILVHTYSHTHIILVHTYSHTHITLSHSHTLTHITHPLSLTHTPTYSLILVDLEILPLMIHTAKGFQS